MGGAAKWCGGFAKSKDGTYGRFFFCEYFFKWTLVRSIRGEEKGNRRTASTVYGNGACDIYHGDQEKGGRQAENTVAKERKKLLSKKKERERNKLPLSDSFLKSRKKEMKLNGDYAGV